MGLAKIKRNIINPEFNLGRRHLHLRQVQV
jgi:hypothetical protein